jgi:hypothetical protein
VREEFPCNLAPLRSPSRAHAQSKTATAFLAVEATRGWSLEKIYANSLNLGAIATGSQQQTGGLVTPVEFRKTVPQGAATSVLLAASPLLDGIGGWYFEGCNESPVMAERPTDFSGGSRDMRSKVRTPKGCGECRRSSACEAAGVEGAVISVTRKEHRGGTDTDCLPARCY